MKLKVFGSELSFSEKLLTFQSIWLHDILSKNHILTVK